MQFAASGQTPIEDFVELAHVEFLADFIGAELEEVGVEVLGIEQFKLLFAKEIDQKHQGDFACIGNGVEHAFAAEHFADGHAIESAHQLIVLPDLEAVGQAKTVEFAIRFDDVFGDPCVAGSERRTLLDDGLKVAVDGGFKHIFAVESGQVFRHFEPMVEGDESAFFWGMPIDLVVFVGIGHRKGSG